MRIFLSQASATTCSGSASSTGSASSAGGQTQSPLCVASDSDDVLEIGGLKIHGVNLESVKSAKLEFYAPLNHGTFVFPGLHDDARISIPKNCSAFVFMTVAKGENGKLKISQIDLSFSEPVVIENPATAFLEKSPSFWGRAANAMADRFAKVQVKGFTVDAKGAVQLDGRLVKGGIFRSALSEVMGHSLPTLNLDIRHLAESIDPGENDKQFGFKFIKAIGHALNEAFFKAQIEIEPTSLSVHNGDVDFQTQKKGANAQLQGHLTFNNALDFSLTTDPGSSFIDSLLGRILLSASVNVEHPLEEFAHVAFKVDGQIDELPQLDVTGHKFSAKGAKFAAAASADVSHVSGKTIDHGQAQVSCEFLDPIFRVESAAVQLKGEAGASLRVRDFVLLKSHNSPSFKGSFSGYLQEEMHHPLMSSAPRRREIEADFRVHKSGRLTMSPLHHPSSILELPFEDAYGLLGSHHLSHSALAKLSDAEFDSQMEKLTNSRITQGNQVRLLVDGCESLPERLRLIREAKDSIWLQTLIFQDDISGMALAEALAAAAKRGVKVKIIVDAQGSASDLETVIADNKAYKLMRESGVDVRLHNDSAISGLRDIIDVIVDNHLCPFTKAELVSGPLTRLIGIACRVIISIQKGQLSVPEAQRLKFIAGLGKGLGQDLGASISTSQPILPTDSNGVIQLPGLIDSVQAIIKQVYSWHEKHFIVDGKHAILGGMNISDPYMFGGHLFQDKHGKISKGWHDADLLIEGPAVEDAGSAFGRNWHHLTGEQLLVKPSVPIQDIQSGVPVQVIQHSPSIKGDNNITNFLTAQINRLQPGETAFFENAYFCASSTQSPLFDAMINAAKRGVKITILTNSETTSDLPAINRAAYPTYDDLLKAGVRIFERSDDRTIHAKIAVIGKRVAVVGSANLDNRSARINSEVIAVVYDESFASHQRRVIKHDLDPRICKEITREYIATIPPAQRAHFAVMSILREMV